VSEVSGIDMVEMVREHLAQAEEHVAQGECHLAQQLEIIGELERDSPDGRASIEMLKQTPTIASPAHFPPRPPPSRARELD